MKTTIYGIVENVSVNEEERDGQESKRTGEISIIESKNTKEGRNGTYETINGLHVKAFGEPLCYNLKQLQDGDYVEAKVVCNIGKFKPDGETKEKIYNRINLIFIKTIERGSEKVENDDAFNPDDHKNLTVKK